MVSAVPPSNDPIATTPTTPTSQPLSPIAPAPTSSSPTGAAGPAPELTPTDTYSESSPPLKARLHRLAARFKVIQSTNASANAVGKATESAISQLNELREHIDSGAIQPRDPRNPGFLGAVAKIRSIVESYTPIERDTDDAEPTVSPDVLVPEENEAVEIVDTAALETRDALANILADNDSNSATAPTAIEDARAKVLQAQANLTRSFPSAIATAFQRLEIDFQSLLTQHPESDIRALFPAESQPRTLSTTQVLPFIRV